MQLSYIALTIGFILMAAIIGFSGCIDSYQSTLRIEGFNTEITIENAAQPLKLELIGSENNIKIKDNVTLESITIYGLSANNTIMLRGEPYINGTSTFPPHDCIIKDSGSNTQIQYYSEGKP